MEQKDILNGGSPSPPASWEAPLHSFRPIGRAWRGGRLGSRWTPSTPGWLGPHVTLAAQGCRALAGERGICGLGLGQPEQKRQGKSRERLP